MYTMELLQRKDNWDDWTYYLMQILFQGVPDAYKAISGKMELLEKPKAAEM